MESNAFGFELTCILQEYSMVLYVRFVLCILFKKSV